MKKYRNLLSEVAQRYSIPTGCQETQDEWKLRLIYSICGMMAYASLWDKKEEEAITIVHLKKRIGSILYAYRSIYPEVTYSLPASSEKLETEITDLFLRTGVIYHRPNKIVPAMKQEQPFGGILFQRGISLDDISSVSGIGFYKKTDSKADICRIKEMFGLEKEDFQAMWQSTISEAQWKSDQMDHADIEFLRMKPPFTNGYWDKQPNLTSGVSILRTGKQGNRLYYLYRSGSGALEISPLPQWRVEAYHYRALACACLSDIGSLPAIMYSEDGSLVHIRLNYLLPPRELEFLKLYSWPETYMSLPCDFRRVLSADLFSAIRLVLSDSGFEFEKEERKTDDERG